MTQANWIIYDWSRMVRIMPDGSEEPFGKDLAPEVIEQGRAVQRRMLAVKPLEEWRHEPLPDPGTARPAAPRRRQGNCGTTITRWLGIRWFGKPWPLRLYREGFRVRVREAPGCGCIVRLKTLTLVAQNAMRHEWAALQRIGRDLKWWIVQ